MAQRDEGAAATPAHGGEEFRLLLKRWREARRWSQERLAERAAMDHSLVSRLESGQRSPTRDAVEKLARGLELGAEQKDRLLIAAGYFPEHVENALVEEPAVRALYLFLRNEEAPQPLRDNLRQVLSGLVEMALAS
ncbi:MAG TPA: helix-turn-helix transcriptional regulator [Thermomicrobiales bacterium]|nr:helix-turn-helix transcriptional regulator [Thermomicrobiales bacterium]